MFSAEGVSPDPRKVKAIRNAPPPTSVSEVRSFLGMVTYCAKFIPNFSDITKPLRELTRKDSLFQWKEEPAEQYVKFTATHSTPKAMSLAEIQQATKADKTLQKLIELIHTNKWTWVKEDSNMPGVNVTELRLFSRVQEEELASSFLVYCVNEH